MSVNKMLTSELNFATQSTANVLWRHAKQKKGKTEVGSFVENID